MTLTLSMPSWKRERVGRIWVNFKGTCWAPTRRRFFTEGPEEIRCQTNYWLLQGMDTPLDLEWCLGPRFYVPFYRNLPLEIAMRLLTPSTVRFEFETNWRELHGCALFDSWCLCSLVAPP